MKKSAMIVFLILSVLVGGALQAGLTDGLVAYYPLDGNADDFSGHGNHGIVHGASLTADRFGNQSSAYLFGGNDYITASDSSILPTGYSPFTLATWVTFDSYGPGGCYLMGQSNGGGNNNKWIFWLGSNNITLISYPSSGSHWNYIGPYDFQLKSWYHVAITNDGTTLTAFVDGNPIGTSSARYIGDASSSFYMGAAEGSGRMLIGSMDDVRIYGRALSDTELSQLASPTVVPLPGSAMLCLVGILFARRKFS